MGARVDYALALPRGLAHPYTHVNYEVDDHTHTVATIGCDYDNVESVAEELVEAVLRCDEDRHDGHGIKHDVDEEAIYKDAIFQLNTRDYFEEYLVLQRKIEHYQMWGGQPPAVVFLPDPEDIEQWVMMVTHPITGLPKTYEVPKHMLDAAPPDPKKYARSSSGNIWYRRGK